jgi:predicted O-linked N-acetylglucosamine transferase (SPINDLY family)
MVVCLDEIPALIHQEAYQKAIAILEQALQEENPSLIYCWYLGLAYLMQGEEEAAQLTWLGALAEQNDAVTESALQSLIQILDQEAQVQRDLQRLERSFLIRQHIREIAPDCLSNLLHLLYDAIDLGTYTPESLSEWQIIEALSQDSARLDPELIEKTLKRVLQVPHPQSAAFADVCWQHMQPQEWPEILLLAAREAAFQHKWAHFAALLTETILKHQPKHYQALSSLPRFYLAGDRYAEAVTAAYNYYNHCHTLESQFFSNCILLKCLLRAGQWHKAQEIGQRHRTYLKTLFQQQPTNLELGTIQFLIVHTGDLLYLQENIVENRWFQNQAAQLFVKNIQANAASALKPPLLNQQDSSRRIRVGYIASTLRKHSVGWLSRWIFKYHDRNTFEIFTYLVQQRPQDQFFATWFSNQVDHYTFLTDNIEQAAQTIRNDQLDILIDLDSLTCDFTCTVLALKPAPIQVTWLGCDASGLPTIDYFIADPYVLPENAQQYYQETIWRLPETYIAVEGFEVDVPTVRRADLEIPDDAIVYFSSQVGSKRYPDTLRLQMQILKQVPNSFFVIKGLADQTAVQDLVTSIAQEEGLSPGRLRFLPWMPNEYVHRANLQIADIVLDTYPYNGATTTLETLWFGIPLITRVGKQFAARNSYAFLKNVGVEEGIAWTDAEYIEWGVKFGIDETLRQQVAWKLHQARHTSPLWDAKRFTLDMENAYQQMIRCHTP